jgi:hypothetical protein
MDIVYICRPGENEELRYSIRSVVKNLSCNNLWVVGKKPSWYTGNFINVAIKDRNSKYNNARLNLETLCSDKRISNDFILMNDDFYVMKPVTSVDYFYDQTLLEKAEYHEANVPKSSYTKLLYNTYDKLQAMDIEEPLNYELHIPMVMNKYLLKPLLKYKNTLWRSMYGNMHNVGGSQTMDVKVYSPGGIRKGFDYRGKDLTFLSSMDNYFEFMKKDLLHKKFPDPSVYESKARS